MDFSEANYYSFNVSGAQDTCYKVLYPAMVNADTFLLSLVERFDDNTPPRASHFPSNCLLASQN